jgi:hypothetical protein
MHAVNKSLWQKMLRTLCVVGRFRRNRRSQSFRSHVFFAEWRIVRQIPVGYKGYAAGHEPGQGDVKVKSGQNSSVQVV